MEERRRRGRRSVVSVVARVRVRRFVVFERTSLWQFVMSERFIIVFFDQVLPPSAFHLFLVLLKVRSRATTLGLVAHATGSRTLGALILGHREFCFEGKIHEIRLECQTRVLCRDCRVGESWQQRKRTKRGSQSCVVGESGRNRSHRWWQVPGVQVKVAS